MQISEHFLRNGWKVACNSVLLLLLLASCTLEYRWTHNPSNECAPLQHPVLSHDPRLHAALKPGVGLPACMQIAWGAFKKGQAITREVMLHHDGIVKGYNPDTGEFDTIPSFSLPDGISEKTRRFRIFVYTYPMDEAKQVDLCKNKMSQVDYDCFSQSESPHCLFYYVFRPKQENGLETLPIDGKDSTQCKIYTRSVKERTQEPQRRQETATESTNEPAKPDENGVNQGELLFSERLQESAQESPREFLQEPNPPEESSVPDAGPPEVTSTEPSTRDNRKPPILTCGGSVTTPAFFAKGQGKSGDYGKKMFVDKSGQVYICGFFESYAEFSPARASNKVLKHTGSSEQLFVAKLFSTGEFHWVQHLNGNNISCKGLFVDGKGTLHVIGQYEGTFATGPRKEKKITSQAVYHLRLNASTGQYQNFRNIMYTQKVVTLVQTHLGQRGFMHLALKYTASATLFPGLTLPAPTQANILLISFDISGLIEKKKWHKTLHSTQAGEVADIITDKNGALYVAGAFRGSMTFDKQYASVRNAAFLVKYNNQRAHEWLRIIDTGATTGQNAVVMSTRLAIDTSQNVYLTGNFFKRIVFGLKVILAKAGMEVYVVKYNSLGKMLWHTYSQGGTNQLIQSTDIVFNDCNKHLYFTGIFTGSLSIGGKTAQATGLTIDLFLAKINISTGKTQALEQTQGTANEHPTAIGTDPTGHLFLLGQYQSGASFFTTPSVRLPKQKALGKYDIFVWKFKL